MTHGPPPSLAARLAPLRLRARIAAGRLYLGAYQLAGRLLRLLPHDSLPVRLKNRLAGHVRPVARRKVTMLYAVVARARPDATFVQIGANDGVMSDPLHEFVMSTRWRGVLVEPVPYLFERLVSNYPDRAGLAFENVAIAAEAGVRPFYYLPADDGLGPDWRIGLGSFLRDVVVSHAAAVPDIERRLVVQDVPCMTFSQLCAKHHLDRFDVLNIDTEGYDFEIIKTIDFVRCRPLVLVHEAHLLSPADRLACAALLRRSGYEQYEEGLDAICINVRDLAPADAPIYQAWKVLRDAAGVPA